MMEKFTLVIGNKNYSSWSLRPWLVLKYFKIPFEEVQVVLAQPGTKEKILQHSPAGKVPILKHGKTVIWESLAICEHLAELFSNRNLWPADKNARATARSIANEMHAGFIHLRKTCPVNIKARKPLEKISPEVQRDITRIKGIWEDCRKQYKQKGDFLFGAFSIADAMYAPIHFRFQTYGIPLEGEAKKYSESVLNLPEVKEWEAVAVKELHVIEHH